MGWFSTIWESVKSVGATVVSVASKVYSALTDEKLTGAYEKLDRMINSDENNSQNNQRSKNNQSTSRELDFYHERIASDIEKKLADQNSKLVRHGSEIAATKKFFALQIELSRLRGSAELIDRSTQNIKIHASSLSVHYQNMRNINGLIDDNNSFRYALNAIISTMNENSERMTHEGVQLKKLQGIDIERREGAISQLAAYDAFDRTRELLRNETIELSKLSSKHLQDIERLKINAANFGGDVGNKIIDFVDDHIIPVIQRTESAGILLRSEVSRLPAAVREENGRLVFKEGRISLEHIQ